MVSVVVLFLLLRALTCIAQHVLAAQQPRVRHDHDHVRQYLLAALCRHAICPGGTIGFQVPAYEGHGVEPQLAEPRQARERLEVVKEGSREDRAAADANLADGCGGRTRAKSNEQSQRTWSSKRVKRETPSVGVEKHLRMLEGIRTDGWKHWGGDKKRVGSTARVGSRRVLEDLLHHPACMDV